MAIPSREPFVAYLRGRAAMLRRQRKGAPAAAERLEVHAHALELLAELVRALPDDDDRILMFGTLAVNDGRFAPGARTEQALSQFAGASREACDMLLTRLVGIARRDALAQTPADRPLG